jgi:WD40 repeat protein
MMRCSWFVTLAVLASMARGAGAQKAPGLKPGSKPIEVRVPSRKQPVSYSNEIAEILEDKCVSCHGSALAENRLSLEEVSAMLKGGKRGPALVPGNADQSLLFRMASHRVEPAMPPKDKPGNAPLTPEDLGLLKVWIDAGAKDDSMEHRDQGKPRRSKEIVLGQLPPGVQPINAVDITADGARVAAGRANLVQVYDVNSGLEIISLGGHKDLIQSIRFSPVGRLLAAGSYQIVTLWTVPTGALGRSMDGHSGPILALAVSADGKRAYSGGDDRTLRAWDLEQGKQEWSSTQPARVTALALASDQKMIVCGSADGIIRLIDPADRKERSVLKGHTAAVVALALLQGGASGHRIASASADGTGRLWTIPDSSPGASERKDSWRKKETEAIVLKGHKGAVRALAETSDSQTVITAGDDAKVRLWSARDGSARGEVATGHSGPILALSLSPDGAMLATGSADKTARLIKLGKEKGVRVLTGHAGAVETVGFSPRGNRLVTGGANGGIKVWETANGQGVIAFGHMPPAAGANQSVRKVAFTSEGSLVSASADSTLKTWRFAGAWTARKTLGPHADRVLALDFSPDGKLLAAGGGEPSRSGELKLWEIGKGLLWRSLDSLHSDTVFGVRFSPDGTRLASASADKFLKVTRVSDGKELRSFEGHTHHVMAVDWKSDGKQLITGGADKVLKLWDLDTGEQVRALQEAGKQITSARWIPGKAEVAAASGDTQVRIWNPDSGSVVRGFSGPGDYVYCVATSADGSRIAAGGAEGVLFVWDGKTGQVLRKIEPPAGRSAPASAPELAVPH